MIQRLIVVGAGGFGRETLDVIEAVNAVSPTFDLLGVVDSHPGDVNTKRLQDRGVAYLGAEESIIPRSDAVFIVAIGSPVVRETVTSRILRSGAHLATLVHPTAVVGSVANIGRGSVVCSGTQVSTNVTLGESVHLNPNSTIGHDTILGDYVSVNPGAIISGEVTVEAGTLIGAGAVILQGLRIGPRSTVGAAACVVKNVEPSMTVKGVPAR